MRKLLFFLFVVPIVAHGQQDMNKDYQAFRKGMLDSYNTYREDILRDYAKFLDGVWNEYDMFRGVPRVSKPKPDVAPIATEPVAPTKPIITEPEEPTVSPDNPTQPEVRPVEKPIVPESNINIPTVDVQFYGQSIKIKAIDVNLNGTTTTDFGSNWKLLAASQRVSDIVNDIKAAKQAIGLNDWFAFEFIMAYAKQVTPNRNEAATALLCQYLSAQIGLDVRLARSGRTPLLLLSTEQTVYERPYIRNGSEKLYVFTINGDKATGGIETCVLPKGASLGRKFNLIINTPIRVHGQHIPFSVSYGGITLTGRINTTMMEMVKHYPQMPVVEYAKSVMDESLRHNLCMQLRQQLGNESESAAINKLLSFVQHGFKYATDQEQHGFEKPYFFEEMFYYPKCDCEDRSIFFAYLLKYAIGVDNVLVGYPEHECVAVNSQTINGDGFYYNKKRYSIADPTFIGAVAGQCMPDFRQVKPEVEVWY